MKSPLGYAFRGRIIPVVTAEGLLLYVEHHICPGSFLSAVLCNDLREALAHGDDENIEALHAIVAWLYNEAEPGSSWGSPEKFNAWLELSS